MKKHIILFAAIIGLFCLLGMNRANAQVFSFFASSGTAWDPYQITDTLDLQQLASVVNNIGGESTEGKYFKLMNDIDFTGVAWFPIGRPIHSVGSKFINSVFRGNFDGNSKVIRNLTYIGNSGIPAGFFGAIIGATIENLGIENCYIENIGDAGGMVGGAGDSYISNCYVTGSVKGSITVGGLVRAASCTYISNCYFSGNVSAVGVGGGCVGGLVGDFWGFCTTMDGGNLSFYPSTISNCYVTGKVSAVSTHPYGYGYRIGGLVGSISDGIIRDCMVAVDSLTLNTDTTINRIVGYVFSPSYAGVTLQNNYALNTMVVQANGSNVPITSHLDSASGFSIPMDSLKSFAFYNTFNNWYQAPWSIQNPLGIWKICDGRDLPFLRWQGISCIFITATAIGNGSISPSGTINVKEDTNQTFIFTPNTCYEIDSLWIDSVYFPDSIAAGSYTFNNVTKNHTIEVSFKRLPPDTVTISDTICYGVNYTENNFNITNAITDSVYFNNDFNTNGCDSVTRLELTVNPLIITQISDSICEGDFYDFHGDTLTASGVYYDTLQAIFRCDSIIELTLTVISIDTTHISIDICEGENYDFFGRQLTEEGIYYQTLQTIHGCDSIIELTLTVEGVGIVETLRATSLRIYPNPTDGKLRIESGELKIETIEIFDITGQVIKTYNSLTENTIDISELPNAMYFITFHSEGQKITRKLVKY